MKQLNSKHGYDAVNKLIRQALQGFRADVVRYFSGDELLCICPQRSADRIAARVLRQLNEVGIGATIAHEPFTGLRSIRSASDRVLQAKQQGKKNRIITLEPMQIQLESEVEVWLQETGAGTELTAKQRAIMG